MLKIDMIIDDAIDFIAQAAGSTYRLLAANLAFLDSPGTYIMLMVIGFVQIPFYARSLYYQYSHPHEYEESSLLRSLVIYTAIILAFVLTGYINFLRFAQYFM
ncbi:MAG: hypothetical protein J7K54_05170 [Candidatus Aenigmarchaeota archaeon]|nr:hypothetical protein [Candidatus Aenigmarchaeota archaeon]